MIYLVKFFFCGIISAFIFPPLFLFPIGFIIFPYLFFLLCDEKIINNKKSQFFYGIFYGLGLNFIILIWIREPLLIDSNTKNISYISYLLVLYISFYYGISFVVLSFFKNNFSKLILLPVLFVITEIIRENFSFGFPWVTFALISSANYFILNLTYYFGTYGLSFITVFLFLIPASKILSYQNKFFLYYYKIYLIISFLLILISLILINLRLNSLEKEKTTQELNISLNQLNIIQSDKSKNSLYAKRFNEITKSIISNDNDLIIFSETDYPYIIKNHDIVKKIQDLISNNQIVIIGGIKNENEKYYNSLYLIKKNSFEVFDKKILVPFGEFLPLRKYLNFFNFIVWNTDFSIGSNKRLMTLFNNFSIIPVICYEIIFLNDLLNDNNRFSPLLINLTNDAWFGKISGPYQHFYLSRIRSAEFNKYLIRVSNNGISAILDNYGRIIMFIPLDIKKQSAINISIPNKLNNLTRHHKLIYLFLIICFIFAVFVNRKNVQYK